MLGAAIGEDLAAIDYDARLARLSARGIALWDVVAMARREGSLDGAIRGATPNPLREFAATHPRLQAVAFNGKTAARLGRAALAEIEGVELIDLPSSSHAYTLAFSEKAKRWTALGALAWRPEAATLAP